MCLRLRDTIVHNSRAFSANQCLRSCNNIVQWFLSNCTCILDRIHVFVSISVIVYLLFYSCGPTCV